MIQKIKNKKACPQCLKHSFCRRGFVLLFAVTLSAILLSIALGITNIAFKEVRFGTNARDTNDAFFAADTGVECAEFYDRSDQNKFPDSGSGPNLSITCAGANTIPNPPSFTAGGAGGIYSFTIINLGSSSQSCAKVTMDKRAVPIVITSNGYNNGSSSGCTPGLNTVERQIEVRYGF